MDDVARRVARTLYGIIQRCDNPNASNYKNYGGKGVRNLLTKAELLHLWDRDNASAMNRPSIDRIDPNGNYEYSNCRFIELSHNSSRRVPYNPRPRTSALPIPDGACFCLRCEFSWSPRIRNPRCCPRCKSYMWNEARTWDVER